MKRFAPVLLFPWLIVRRFLPALYLVRAVYRAPSLRWLQRTITTLFDPNSIRRHTGFSIPNRYVNVEGKLGERLRVNLGDHIGWNIFLNGYFDLVPSLVAITLASAKQGSVYLDVGANIGDTSIAIANRGISTVGIDASAIALSELCHNIAMNSPIPYTVIHAAVASQSIPLSGDVDADYLELHVPVGNTGAASVHAGWNASKNSHAAMLASPRRVSDIVDSLAIKSLCCIKLDVEGAEQEAMSGMASTLEKYRCPILFEYLHGYAKDVGLEASSIVDLLPEGYQCFAIDCDHVTENSATMKITDFDINQSYENVLAVYRELPPELNAARTPAGMDVPFA